MDKQAVNLLVKKNVKELKVNGGNVNLTFDSKALKELKKEMNTAVVIKMKQTDKKNLSARAGKLLENVRFMIFPSQESRKSSRLS